MAVKLAKIFLPKLGISLMLALSLGNFQSARASTLPFGIHPSTWLNETITTSTFIHGLFLGLVLIILFYALILYLNLKQKIFLWMMVYLSILASYIYSRADFFPHLTNNYPILIVVLSELLIYYSFSRFYQLILNTKKYHPRWHQWHIGILGGIIIMGFLYFLTPYSLFWLTISRLLILGGVTLMFFSTLNNTQLNRVQNRLLRTSIYFLLGAIFILILNGMGFGHSTQSMMLIGLLLVSLHILFFSTTILHQVQKLAQENELLWNKIRITKKELLQSYMEGMESEKVALVETLDLNIQSTLQQLILQLKKEKEPNPNTLTELSKIQDDIKHMAIELTDPNKSGSDFIKRIQALIRQHETPLLKFALVSYDFSIELTKNTEYHLYRIIQEAIQNIEKYAQASHVEIQLLQNDDDFILVIEDNGIGFDTNINPNGIGLYNIRSRVAQIDAEFNLITSPNKGVSLLITKRITP